MALKYRTSIFKKIYSFSFDVNVYIACIDECVDATFVLCPWRQEENLGYPGAGVIVDHESPCGSWELKHTEKSLLTKMNIFLASCSSATFL